MKILLSGSSGLIGSALAPVLKAEGHQVMRVVRTAQPTDDGAIFWNPVAGQLDLTGLEGWDVVIHLAAESIANGRWNAARKARIRDSRVKGTSLLAERVAQLKRPPETFISASAVGYYGDRGDELLTEQSAPGSNFLAGVCQEWEAATHPASDGGIRVVCVRFGAVLSSSGGALAKMLTPFRMGVGGIIGSGTQYFSWISIEDAVRALLHVLRTDSLRGPVNTVAPNPITNSEFTKALGRTLHRPTIFPMPAFAARLALGEMADELLLASARVAPSKLLAADFVFNHAEMESALKKLLRRG